MPHLLFFILESIAMGFLMAAPVGPVGALCLRRVLKSGWVAGFVTGFAVAVCDAFFGLVSSLGLSSVSDLFIQYEQTIRLCGGGILLVIGWQIYHASVPKNNSGDKSDEDEEGKAAQPSLIIRKYLKYFFSALVLALTNPLAIFSFAAVYVSLGMGSFTAHHPLRIFYFVIGILIGSSLWWWLLSLVAFKLKDRLSSEKLIYINKGCGLIIGLFGFVSLITFLRHY
jgi:threonine/homoserine/homoserine lactone efflux protein